MNLWMKRALGAAAIGGSLLALGPAPPRKEVMTGSPAEAAGQHALMVTGR